MKATFLKKKVKGQNWLLFIFPLSEYQERMMAIA